MIPYSKGMCDLTHGDRKETLLMIGRLISIPLKKDKVVIRFSFHSRLLYSYSFEGDTEEECIGKIYAKVKEEVWRSCK